LKTEEVGTGGRTGNIQYPTRNFQWPTPQNSLCSSRGKILSFKKGPGVRGEPDYIWHEPRLLRQWLDRNRGDVDG